MNLNFPANLLYTKDHEWVKVDGNIATVGITDYAQSQLGDIVFVDIQTEGDNLDIDEVFGALEAVKTVAEALMPLSGVVTKVNPQLESEPQLINNDPYGGGWMIEIEMSNPEELNGLISSEE
ncbi:MAG: glycine cleavage system protein GcvH, partial [Bacteroidales bacterium]|nr:glycine cleavage system protein GcvH [Bacteroidales bacterium]